MVLPEVKDLMCLDAGCGSGYSSNCLASQAKLVIGDVTAHAVGFAIGRCGARNLTYLVFDVDELPFAGILLLA
jgi:2-polyprenyl-3-methyl-5-hydroxy-6-metoxy-1,4-benzoquinol methylase